ncbi:hypothetical protein CMV_020149 [Castanea mollissima]|uniref:Uncharacterized protein n=1 Tax=Castanea mollissima TaxID=60419 RepID=A0A8J4QM95_9ROSI|nr:hypothetical protein CMV_020149 [Castanea mollissima]
MSKKPSHIHLQLDMMRISDIDGPNQDIPMLRNMTGIARLVLRNCKISGEIPAYIWTMKNLDMFQIDLSYINLLESSAPPCRDSLNLFKSFSGRDIFPPFSLWFLITKLTLFIYFTNLMNLHVQKIGIHYT